MSGDGATLKNKHKYMARQQVRMDRDYDCVYVKFGLFVASLTI